MGEDQWHAPTVCRPLVHEVDLDPVELGSELLEAVQLPFLRAPVEPVGPVVEHGSQEARFGALVPADFRNLIGPARIANPPAKVGEDAIVDVDRERLDAHGGIIFAGATTEEVEA